MNEKERAKAVFDRTVAELDQYENKYGMSSEDFLARFESGDLPEEEEFFSWRTTYTGLINIVKRFGFRR